jgi:hypothetical protein
VGDLDSPVSHQGMFSGKDMIYARGAVRKDLAILFGFLELHQARWCFLMKKR